MARRQRRQRQSGHRAQRFPIEPLGQARFKAARLQRVPQKNDGRRRRQGAEIRRRERDVNAEAAGQARERGLLPQQTPIEASGETDGVEANAVVDGLESPTLRIVKYQMELQPVVLGEEGEQVAEVGDAASTQGVKPIDQDPNRPFPGRRLRDLGRFLFLNVRHSKSALPTPLYRDGEKWLAARFPPSIS